MKNKRTILIIAAVALTLVSAVKFIGGFANEDSPVSQYYGEIKNLKVEENLTEVMPILQGAAEKLQKMQTEGSIDLAVIEPDFEKALSSLESKKSEIAKLTIEDPKVKEINNYLISSYDELINGYRNILKGFKDGNSDLLTSAGNELTKAQEDIQKWQQMLNE